MGSPLFFNRLTVTYWFSDLTSHFHELLVYTYLTFFWTGGR